MKQHADNQGTHQSKLQRQASAKQLSPCVRTAAQRLGVEAVVTLALLRRLLQRHALAHEAKQLEAPAHRLCAPQRRLSTTDGNGGVQQSRRATIFKAEQRTRAARAEAHRAVSARARSNKDARFIMRW
jgi:hypothetical protein